MLWYVCACVLCLFLGKPISNLVFVLVAVFSSYFLYLFVSEIQYKHLAQTQPCDLNHCTEKHMVSHVILYKRLGREIHFNGLP